MSKSATYYNTTEWVNRNRHFFKPPVGNKMMHDEQLKIFYVGGPNLRDDYHLEEGEELFYMHKGDMCLKVYANNKFQDIIIREGEIFLLPARILHSPQRKRDTIGLVIERRRMDYEQDCVRYFVKSSNKVLFERWFHCVDLGSELVPIIQEFAASEERKTGQPTKGSVSIDPPYQSDNERKLHLPINLKHWLLSNTQQIHDAGSKRLYGTHYQTDVIVYGRGYHSFYSDIAETFLWQLEGKSNVSLHNEIRTLRSGDDTLLVPEQTRFSVECQNDSVVMAVTMNPRNKRH